MFYIPILRFCSSLQIIPPGMEFHHIVPHDGDMDGETEANEDHPTSPDPPIWSEVLVTLYAFTLMSSRKIADESFRYALLYNF